MNIHKTLLGAPLTAVVRVKPMATPAPSPVVAAKPSTDAVSLSKVAQMRAAIESGTFKVDAGRIADGLLRSGDLTR